MPAKRVRVSSDGITFRTLPGNTGEISNEAGVLDDTIFGQSFRSGQPGLINWNVSANGLYKGFAGYAVDIKAIANTTPTTATALPTTLVSGKTYQITDATKRFLDPSTAVVVKISTVAVAAANIESIDYVNGRVTFISSYTPASPPTIDGAYLTLVMLAKYRSYTLNMTADAVDTTDIPTAQGNSGRRTFEQGIKSVSLEISGVYAASNAYRAALEDRSLLLVEINPDGNGKSWARGFFRYSNQGSSGNVGALEEETITLQLAVPDVELMQFPFTWAHAADTTLNAAIIACLAAWQNGSVIDVQYLPDGTAGVTGDAIVTEMTLSGGLEAMNAFAISFQGTGALAAV